MSQDKKIGPREEPKVTEGDAKPIENPEGFCPSAAEIGPDIPCVTVVPC